MSTVPPQNPPTPPFPQQPPQGPAPTPTPSSPADLVRRYPWVAGIVVLVLVCCLCGTIVAAFNGGGKSTADANGPTATSTQAGPTATPKPTNTPKPPTATPTPSKPHFGDGTYQVGKDIQPGTYRTRDGSSGCYYERLKGFSGDLNDIIANNNTDAPAVVTIAASDAGFKSQGCGTWTQDLSQITQSKTSFGDGIYIVGTDIEPGTYRNSGGQGCYLARLRGFGGTLDDIIANDNTDTATIVTISASDKGFESTRCGTWTKQ